MLFSSIYSVFKEPLVFASSLCSEVSSLRKTMYRFLVDPTGVEPVTSAMQMRRSSQLSYGPESSATTFQKYKIIFECLKLCDISRASICSKLHGFKKPKRYQKGAWKLNKIHSAKRNLPLCLRVVNTCEFGNGNG